ncbi:MAG: glycoside hydrolase family 48 protein [Oscillospiraceae bacterium]|nr:glycoside hydrolase family 48 protein [Oscillospiraceae bacterium]
MQFKKNRALLAAVLAAAMASSALMTCTASAAGTRTKEEKYGDETYAQRFLSLYDDVVTNGQENGYLSKNNVPSGGFGIPYHAVEECIVEAPDYGHETTSEAMSYIVWMAAMQDNISKNTDYYGSATNDLSKAWKTLEAMVPTVQTGFWTKDNLSSQVCAEYPTSIESYPSEGSSGNTGSNPIHKYFTSAYSSQGGEYLLHWLADVDDWYGFGGSAKDTLGTFTFINTFQRGDSESCFETIPHPCVEDLKYGDVGGLGMKFAFETSAGTKKWSYTNAPDAENRAIQAVYAANRWGVGDSNVTAKAGMMGDMVRNNMFDKYYKTIGCQNMNADSNGGAGYASAHYLMSWYSAWGGAADGAWAWQISASHCHQFYQSPLAAYGLLYDSGLNAAMKATDATKDYTSSLQRQLELYMWLQSAEGPFAGGLTNCWNGKYDTYPSGVPTFYDMAYIEHPVYADPGSNYWIGNQVWATQRLAELYYIIKTDGDGSKGAVKPGGVTMEEGLSSMLKKWVDFFLAEVELTDDGDYAIPSNLIWSGAPDTWSKTYNANANSNLHATVQGKGNSDLGCVTSLANTLIWYAAAEGVEASGVVAEGTDTASKALYLGQQLLDRVWENARDDIGLSRTEHNGSLTRIFAQPVYVPAGKQGTYPYGDVAKNGIVFCDIRSMYESNEKYMELKAAYEADIANGAKFDEKVTQFNGAPDVSDFTNVASVDLNYHRFWHAGDIMMGLGTMYELYPDVTPSTSETPITETNWGDVNCDGDVKTNDVILLNRFLAEDTTANVSAQGLLNADCAYDGQTTPDDSTLILKYLAGLIPYAELGNQ